MKEIRQKLLYTLAMMVVIRIGSQLPAPGIDRTYFSNWFAAQTGDTFSFVDAFTGGSFLNMSVPEHYTLHYFFHHHPAPYDRNSET